MYNLPDFVGTVDEDCRDKRFSIGNSAERSSKRQTYFSRAILSLLMRSRASEILDKIYCVATYPTPITPSPIAMGVLFRRNHRRVAEIMTQW
jgi:hypothetical protein